MRQDSYAEFNASVSKPIIDRIDATLARHYGFTDEEVDFIVNYDIKYRLGADAERSDGRRNSRRRGHCAQPE